MGSVALLYWCLTFTRQKVYTIGIYIKPVPCCCFCSVVVDSLLIVALIVCEGSVYDPCFVTQYLLSFLVLQSS